MLLAISLRANSKLRSAKYSIPVLGLIFLRFADFSARRRKPNWHSLDQK